MTTSIPHKVSALRAAEQLDSTRDKLELHLISFQPLSQHLPLHLRSALPLLTAPFRPQHHPPLPCSTVVRRTAPFSKRPLPPLYSTSPYLFFPLHAPFLRSACMPPPQHCFPTSTSASDHPALITNKVAPPINPTTSGFCVTLVPLPGSVPFLFKPVSTES